MVFGPYLLQRRLENIAAIYRQIPTGEDLAGVADEQYTGTGQTAFGHAFEFGIVCTNDPFIMRAAGHFYFNFLRAFFLRDLL